MTHLRRISMLLSLLALFAGTIMAAAPTVMNYQGRLTDNSPGQVAIDATLAMEFRIYATAIGGGPLWTETWGGGVTVTDGIFSVLLGSNGSPLPEALFTSGTARYLEIWIDGETLSPRQQLGAAAWAHHSGNAEDADALDGLPPAGWQKRVAGFCPAGQSIRSINAAGGVICEPDNDTIIPESDPQVASTTVSRIPRWDGAALTDGSVIDTGSTVQHTTPVSMDDRLDVAGELTTGVRLIENGLFSGVLTDVKEADLPGWTECYSALYNVVQPEADIRDNQCTEDLIMMACRETASDTLTVAAMGHRQDVFYDVGIGVTDTHTANGVKWYFDEVRSWGYVNAADDVARNSCDVLGTGENDERLCWHTLDGGAGGYRCGATLGLNNSVAWEKVVYQRSAAGSHVEPNLYDINTGTFTLEMPETDPQVASSAVGRIPRWNGTALADSAIIDNGGGTVTVTGAATVTGNLSATSRTGSGAGLTSLNASNLTTGTLPDARLSAFVARENIVNVFTADQRLQGSGRYFIIDALSASQAGFLFQDNGANRWWLRQENNTEDLTIRNYLANALGMSMDGDATGNTKIRNLQLTVTTRTDSLTAIANTSPVCLADETRTGGGCRCASGFLEKSYPSSSNAWYCECSVSTSIDAHSVCMKSTNP